MNVCSISLDFNLNSMAVPRSMLNSPGSKTKFRKETSLVRVFAWVGFGAGVNSSAGSALHPISRSSMNGTRTHSTVQGECEIFGTIRAIPFLRELRVGDQIGQFVIATVIILAARWVANFVCRRLTGLLGHAGRV